MNRVMAILALVVLGGFLWILVAKVGRTDLSVVVAIAYVLAVWDTWKNLAAPRR